MSKTQSIRHLGLQKSAASHLGQAEFPARPATLQKNTNFSFSLAQWDPGKMSAN